MISRRKKNHNHHLKSKKQSKRTKRRMNDVFILNKIYMSNHVPIQSDIMIADKNPEILKKILDTFY